MNAPGSPSSALQITYFLELFSAQRKLPLLAGEGSRCRPSREGRTS